MNTTWHLIAPDLAGLDTVARRAEPFVLWPVGDRPLLAVWMDEAVRQGFRQVKILAADRPTMIRDYIAGGDYWSCTVEVISSPTADWPAHAMTIDHLPGHSSPARISNAAELITHWLQLNIAWIVQRPVETVTIDRHIEGGGWIGPQAKIHPTAKLTPPFWIGTGAEIGARAQIGPNALVGAACVVDEDAEIAEGVALSGTYIGQHVSLQHKIADGGLLFDSQRGCRVEIGEEFIISPLSSSESPPSLFERLAALGLAIIGSFASLGLKESLRGENYLTHRTSKVTISTGDSGPLLVRRRFWLYRVAKGQWHLIGVLPRTESSMADIPADVRDTILRTPTGVFSLADVHGCHTAGDEEEWVHALFQAVPSGIEATKTVRRKLWKLAWTTP